MLPRETERALSYALEAARAGRFVEIGCHAGHGRTGTALAALMILSGAAPDDALDKVWSHYCEFAVETVVQERYLHDLRDHLKGRIDASTREVRQRLTHVRSNVWASEDAMLKVWNEYCEHAIETVGQERYLFELEQERKNDGHQLR